VKHTFALCLSLTTLLFVGTAPIAGAVAPGGSPTSAPAPVSFREDRARGLLVRTWINGAGPYTFAIDTGAGVTILSERVATEARVEVRGPRAPIGGLSGAASSTAQPVAVASLAVGEPENLLPARGATIVSNGIPEGVDGVLDPTEVYTPLGYVLDMPNGEIRAFDPRAYPLREADAPEGGAVVAWLVDRESRRPYVRLSDGRLALVDTGSRFGLALGESAAIRLGLDVRRGEDRGEIRDFGGGIIRVRRIAPITIGIGALSLVRVPTDVLAGSHDEAPTLLGRDALRPFEIAFDPLHKLVSFAPPTE
jgi:predicted aspartyl protease